MINNLHTAHTQNELKDEHKVRDGAGYSQYIVLVTGKDWVENVGLDLLENKAGYHFAPGLERFAQVSPW